MIRLLNTNTITYEMRMTKNPITNPQQSPQPTGKKLEDLDSKSPDYVNQKNAILNHPNYSESKVYYLEPGINVFENDEQAEYLYATLGNPEDAGLIPVGRSFVKTERNKNYILEVDEEGKEIRDHLFAKYRKQTSIQLNTNLELDVVK